MSSTHTPARRVTWLKLALVASLAVNCLLIGAGLARYYVAHTPQRMLLTSQMQLIPRRFIGELDKARQAELLGVIKSYDKAFRDGRRAARDQVAALAGALEAEPYDDARVKAAVEAFAASSDGLLRTGGAAALAVIDRLTAPERKLLAAKLRARSAPRPDDKAAAKPDAETPAN